MKKNSINLAKEDKFKFPSQHPAEKVVLVVRKHILILLPHIIQIIVFSLLPILFYTMIAPFILPALSLAPYNKVFLHLSIVYYGFLWILTFRIWVDYYLDVCIVTNQRLLDIEQIGFFNRTVSELDLKNIQDITSNVHGLFQTMFGFGNIKIQTASQENKFELPSVPHPVTVRRKIIELATQAKKSDKFIIINKDE
ncbi:PH domain-containing protein [Patescibacteria group bacterium]|nr:PH domain-containing protein [Patescibacteria group bacterium]